MSLSDAQKAKIGAARAGQAVTALDVVEQ